MTATMLICTLKGAPSGPSLDVFGTSKLGLLMCVMLMSNTHEQTECTLSIPCMLAKLLTCKTSVYTTAEMPPAML